MPRVDVQSDASSHVGRRFAPEELSRPSIPELGADLMPGLLVDVEHFQPRSIGVDVREVKRVAVTQTRRVETGAIIVNTTGSIDDLIPAVIIDVADTQIMVPLPRERPIGHG